MPRKRESRETLARRVKQEFDTYGDSVALSEFEAAAVLGRSEYTLKSWRHSGENKGPQPTYIDGFVTYTAGALRQWRDRKSAEDHQEYLEKRRRLIEANRKAREEAEALSQL